jgi:putative DNA primase/helicase
MRQAGAHLMAAGSDPDDLDAIRDGLNSSIEGLAVTLLGDPAHKGGAEWRWGRKGSMAVTVRGRWRGRWRDHEADTRGDGLALIQREQGGSFPEAKAYARSYLGMPERGEAPPMDQAQRAAHQAERIRASAERKTAQAAETEAEAAERITRASAFWAAGRPIAGTVAESYLTGARAIPCPAAGWPDALRFHPGRRALMVAATEADGAVVAVQLVHLTAEGQKAAATDARPTKQSYGLVSAGAVRLPGRGLALQMAEGPETGLSVWAATGRETWVALGAIGKLVLPPERPVIVCADDDPPDQPATKTLRKAIGEWRAAGRSVAVVMPRAQPRGDRGDFNDLMRDEGAAAVATRIEGATGPRPLPPGRPLGEARKDLRQAVGAFFEAGRAYDPGLPDGPPPVHAIRVGVGIGKSEEARTLAARELAAMRARGDQRSIAILVPTHKLGAEQAASFEALPEARAAGLKAAVWRGRAAEDPAKAGRIPKVHMCSDLEAVEEVQALALPVEESCCSRRETRPRRKRGDAPIADDAEPPKIHHCPFYDACPYQAQKRQRADVWIGAHELLYSEKPAAFGEIGFVIVDEAAWQDGLEGVDGPATTLSLDAMAADVWLPGDDDRHALRDAYGLTQHALAAQPDGPLRRDAVLAMGLMPSVAETGRTLTWNRKVDPKLRPGMSAAERRGAAREAAGNRTVIRTAKLFGALAALVADGGPEASGWIHLATEPSDHGPVRVVRLRGRREVRKGWIRPTLVLDAILDIELLRPFWPQVRVTAEVEAETPHMRVRQLVGRDFPKSALLPDEWRENDQAELGRRQRNSRDLRAAVLREARAFGGAPVLLVAQKGVEDAWRAPEAGPLPSYVTTAHHNDVAGRDEWRHVRAQIVVGRTLPKASDAERMAEALTGAAVTVTTHRYTRDEAAITLRTGETIPTTALRHPDPMAERVRWQICEGELLQIIGRCRGVSRTGGSPVDVLLLTDTALPLAVDAVVAWEALRPSPADLMLSAGGVVLTDGADAHAAYPNLWPSAWAAQKALRITATSPPSDPRYVASPLNELPKGESNVPRSLAAYQRTGAGRRPARAYADPAVVPDLVAWLRARLGPLALVSMPQAAAPASAEAPVAARVPLDPPPPQATPPPPPPPPALPAEARLRLLALSARLDTARPALPDARVRLDALSQRLVAAFPVVPGAALAVPWRIAHQQRTPNRTPRMEATNG